MHASFRLQGVFVMLLFVLVAGTAYAQPRRMSPEERAEALKERLELTTAQTDSVRAMYEATDAEMRAAFQSAEGDRSAIRELITQIRDSADKKIEGLLTDEQKEKFEEYKKERESRRGFGPGGNRPRRPSND